MIFLYLGIFVASCIVLAIAGDWLVSSLGRIARFLRWKEFVVSFFLMSFATSLPELIVGITSALDGIPELSFGNIVGQNIIHFTLSIALCLLFVPELDVESRTIRMTAVFTFFASLLPLALIYDGSLSRADGFALMALFLLYAAWLFSKKDYFSKTYRHTVHDGAARTADEKERRHIFERIRMFFRDFGFFALGAVLLVGAAQGIVFASSKLSLLLSLPLVVVGILIVSLGTALPETYFSITAARKGNTGLLVGNLLGATAVSSTMVLGIVSLIHPIVITDFSPYLVSRIFLFASALFFLIFLRTGKKIGRAEGIVLFCIYALFVAVEGIANL